MTQCVTNRAVLQFMIERLEQDSELTDRQRLIRDEYLQSLPEIERISYARHLAGASAEQIAGELFLPAASVLETLIAIRVQLRMRIFPIDPETFPTEK